MDFKSEHGQALIETLVVCIVFASVLIIAEKITTHQKEKISSEYRTKNQKKWSRHE